MHGQPVCFIDTDTARGLLKQGYATRYGRKRTIGLRLIVPLSKVTGNGPGERALTLANLTGTRFVFRQKIRTRTRGTQSVFRLKPLHVTESPEHALLRILTPPALESARHELFYECSLAERGSNPVAQKRRDVKEIFRACPGAVRFRARFAARSAPAPSSSADTLRGSLSRQPTLKRLAAETSAT